MNELARFEALKYVLEFSAKRALGTNSEVDKKEHILLASTAWSEIVCMAGMKPENAPKFVLPR